MFIIRVVRGIERISKGYKEREKEEKWKDSKGSIPSRTRQPGDAPLAGQRDEGGGGRGVLRGGEQRGGSRICATEVRGDSM